IRLCSERGRDPTASRLRADQVSEVGSARHRVALEAAVPRPLSKYVEGVGDAVVSLAHAGPDRVVPAGEVVVPAAVSARAPRAGRAFGAALLPAHPGERGVAIALGSRRGPPTP